VGTVCFGWALSLPAEDAAPLIVSEQRHFQGDRSAVRRQSAGYALLQASRLLRQRLQDQPLAG
jgi:nicotinamide mononucleotide (NMN) deamidase PncC